MALLSLLSLLSLFLLGCRSYDTAPNGLQRGEHEFRRQLAAGHADSALLQLSKSKQKTLPSDELLRLLFEGVAAHYAGQYDRSATAFDRAALVAEDRTTKSISRAALSVMVNDLSLAYEPSRTELLLLPYYAALTYAHAGAWNEAAVEARRLSALLQKLEDHNDAPDARLHAFFRYFAGVVFEAAGEHADADVAYRNAHALADWLPGADSIADHATGEVVVLIEHGFAPYRVQESLLVMLNDYETHEFDRDRPEDDRRLAASRVAERVLAFANGAGPRDGTPKARTLWVPAATQTKAARHTESCDSTTTKDSCHKDDDDDHSYLLRMSWPVMYVPASVDRTVRVRVDSLEAAPLTSADVSAGVLGDFRREQPAIVARTVVRAAAKYALSRSAEKSAGKKNEALGDVVGALANITGALTEQADTRSWHLLPGSISMVRMRVPAGTHHLRIDAGSDTPLETGAITVKPGRVTVLSKRVWH